MSHGTHTKRVMAHTQNESWRTHKMSHGAHTKGVMAHENYF